MNLGILKCFKTFQFKLQKFYPYSTGEEKIAEVLTQYLNMWAVEFKGKIED